MPTLTLQFKETNLSNYKIEKDKPFIIGRRETSDIVIATIRIAENILYREHPLAFTSSNGVSR